MQFVKEMEAFKKNNKLDELMENAADFMNDPRTKEAAAKVRRHHIMTHARAAVG